VHFLNEQVSELQEQKNDIQLKLDEARNKYVLDLSRQESASQSLSEKLLKAHKETNDLKKDLLEKSSKLESVQIRMLETESKLESYKEQVLKINRQKDS